MIFDEEEDIVIEAEQLLRYSPELFDKFIKHYEQSNSSDTFANWFHQLLDIAEPDRSTRKMWLKYLELAWSNHIRSMH